jgi:hypothetical protein
MTVHTLGIVMSRLMNIEEKNYMSGHITIEVNIYRTIIPLKHAIHTLSILQIVKIIPFVYTTTLDMSALIIFTNFFGISCSGMGDDIQARH